MLYLGHMMDQERATGYTHQIEVLINQIGTRPEDELVRAFIAFDELEEAPEELRSLAIDAMLVAEGDTKGEFKTKEELLEFKKTLGAD